jgi:uncharacterized protein YjbI with pentapeptide repeats
VPVQKAVTEDALGDFYRSALDQIASHNTIETRVGGIFALERVAKSESFYWPVIENLTIYLRTNHTSPRPSLAIGRDMANTVLQGRPVIPADVEAVLSVLKRRRHHFGNGEELSLDLRSTYLRSADLSRAHWEHALFDRAMLDYATFSGAFLRGASFARSEIKKARYIDADLTGACFKGDRMWGANFTNAKLDSADLREAHIGEAIFTGASLVETDFTSAFTNEDTDFRGTDLSRVLGLTWDQVRNTKRDLETRLPKQLENSARESKEA